MTQWIAWMMIVDYQVRPGDLKLHSFAGGEASKRRSLDLWTQLPSSISQVRPQPLRTWQPQLESQIDCEFCCIPRAKITRFVLGADTFDLYSAVRSTLTFQVAASRYYAPLAQKFQIGWYSTTSTKPLFSNTALAIVPSLTQPSRWTAVQLGTPQIEQEAWWQRIRCNCISELV